MSLPDSESSASKIRKTNHELEREVTMLNIGPLEELHRSPSSRPKYQRGDCYVDEPDFKIRKENGKVEGHAPWIRMWGDGIRLSAILLKMAESAKKLEDEYDAEMAARESEEQAAAAPKKAGSKKQA